ncbi:MAG: 16S rRNA (uracil(1498)-N(3))-methyltransferase [Bacteroidetes bacterium]|nr:MAG: 16S rRNA (uracil(1498)-N(3))-methyltransferase [Bacteroidota bacterium]
MQLFYQPGVPQGVNHLDSEESKHCIKVLRKKLNDPIDIVDGKGTFYKALITETNPRKTPFSIVGQRAEDLKNYSIHLAVAPTKRLERIEWLVEKATELGVDRISFIQCRNSERHRLRLERLQRKAISAMKQSIKATLPRMDELVSFVDFFDSIDPEANKLLAHLSETARPLLTVAMPGASYCVLVGPEGDFSKEEIAMAADHGFQTMHLGNSRLRTETAALAAVVGLALSAGRVDEGGKVLGL